MPKRNGEWRAGHPDQGGRHVHDHVDRGGEDAERRRPALRGLEMAPQIDDAPHHDHGEQKHAGGH
jgi:hypothetical protein